VPTAQEIAALRGIVARDIQDCQSKGLGADWKLNIAYNAALTCATIGLAACGYRSTGEAHHYRVIQSLRFTVRCSRQTVAQLDTFRKRRNISDYERAGTASQADAREMFELAKALRRDVDAWLKGEHPELT
jgi:hypothetical protein